jgi:hypothetical protein
VYRVCAKRYKLQYAMIVLLPLQQATAATITSGNCQK